MTEEDGWAQSKLINIWCYCIKLSKEVEPIPLEIKHHQKKKYRSKINLAKLRRLFLMKTFIRDTTSHKLLRLSTFSNVSPLSFYKYVNHTINAICKNEEVKTNRKYHYSAVNSAEGILPVKQCRNVMHFRRTILGKHLLVCVLCILPHRIELQGKKDVMSIIEILICTLEHVCVSIQCIKIVSSNIFVMFCHYLMLIKLVIMIRHKNNSRVNSSAPSWHFGYATLAWRLWNFSKIPWQGMFRNRTGQGNDSRGHGWITEYEQDSYCTHLLWSCIMARNRMNYGLLLDR